MKLFFIVMTTLLAIRATAEESTWTITEDCIVGIPVAASGSSSHRRLNNPLNNPTTTSTNHSNNTKHDFTIKVQEEKHVYASAQEVGFLTLCIFIGVISRR
jgi:Na+/glutamate symporter